MTYVERPRLAAMSELRKVSQRWAGWIRNASLLTAGLLLPALAVSQTFIQATSNPVSADAASVAVTYASPQTAGNLNVVVVGWSDTTSSVTSVADDNTNVYRLVGTTAGAGVSQAVYYAKSILLPNNPSSMVTVTFSKTATTPDVRVLEYSGLSTTAPLDNWLGNSGISTTADSGGIVTSSTDLILGAGTTAAQFVSPGSGFTQRSLTVPFGDIVEDSNAALAAGTYNATGTLTNGGWVMQGVAFSTTPITFTNPPTVTSIAPLSGPDTGGTSVTITGTDFQPGAVVLFGGASGTSAVNCVVADDATITCLTPAGADGATDVSVMNVDGQTGTSAGAFTFVLVVPPTFTAITPATGPTNGSGVTITGTNFQDNATVKIGGLPAGDVVVADSGTITATTPGLPLGAADVEVTNPDTGRVTADGAFVSALGTGSINYVQAGTAVTSAAVSTLPVTMPAPQTAGNLNVVIVGWNDTTATLSSVTDTEGNTYTAALAPTAGTGLTQVIYYAKNITGELITPNQITATFDQPAQAVDVRVLEYSGLNITSPLDEITGDSGTGTVADSGSCTTTGPVELVVAAATVSSRVTGPGAGFNLLALTNPNGDNAEHRITTVAGSCGATTPITNGNWVMQSVSFIPAPDFSVSATPASQTVAAGDSAAYTVSVTPLNGFNSAVALTCTTGLPTGATCTFAPASVTPSGTAATSALTIATTTGTPVGLATVTISAAGTATHTTTVDLNVTAAVPGDFTLAGSDLTPASVTAGGTSTSTITLAPVSGFSSDVTLSCTTITPVVALPPTCSFAPATITGGSGTSTLTVHTSPVTTAALAPRSRGIFLAMWLPIGGLALIGAGLTSRKKRWLGFLLGCALFSGLIFLNACGGSSSSGGGGGSKGTPAGAYTITVSATGGSMTHTQTLNLTVTH